MKIAHWIFLYTISALIIGVPAYRAWWIESTKAEIKRDQAAIDAAHASLRCAEDITAIEETENK
jgi:hypothetical protein